MKSRDMGDVPLLDLTSMIEDVGEEDVVYEILSAYLDEVAERIPKLRNAIDSRDFEVAVRQAHSIKGGALNFSAHVLAEPAMKLETMAKTGVVDESASLISAVEDGYVRIRAYLNTKIGG